MDGEASVEASVEVTDASLAESQGLEIVSDADLQGETSVEETSETTEETPTEETSEETSETADKSEESSETESKEEKSGDTSSSLESESDDVSTTKMVPLEALHESRNTIKYLKDQIQTLMTREDKPVEVVKEVETEPEDTFKVLTEAEFMTLTEDNPAEAMQYSMQYMQYQAKLSDKKAAEETANASTDYVNRIVNESLDAMEEVIPGIFENGSEAQKELVEYADSVGFTDDMFYLTNPQTQVILPGDTEPLLLGDQAVSVLKMLVNTRSNVSEAKNTVKETAVDEKAIETRLRSEITAELVAKFKSEGATSFKSLEDIPKTHEEAEFGTKILTDAQFEKLSDKDQEAYLAGA